MLELARQLASSAEGLSVPEMAANLGVCRRTAERMRTAIWEVFPQMEMIQEGTSKRFRIPRGLDGFFQAPETAELVELQRAIEHLRSAGHVKRAETLQALDHKVRAALKSEQRRKLAPDIDALSRAELTGVRAGPQPHDDPKLLAQARHAILGMCKVRFRYSGGSKPGSLRTLTPYGLLFDRMNYLVGVEKEGEQPRNWRLDRISQFEILDEPGGAPDDFSMEAYAARSFGVFHDTQEEVELIISGEMAEDARRWRFHPTQTVTPNPDGTVKVCFRSGGMRELAWHLFTWRDNVKIVAPERLREVMREELRLAASVHS